MPEKKKILIIDDDFGSLKLEKTLLEYSGYEVISAQNAEAGLPAAQEKMPDMIILDYWLPGINGEEALKILMADKKTERIPVVFVTASAMDEDKKRLEFYHCKVITKPINTRTFVQDIEEGLHASK